MICCCVDCFHFFHKFLNKGSTTLRAGELITLPTCVLEVDSSALIREQDIQAQELILKAYSSMPIT